MQEDNFILVERSEKDECSGKAIDKIENHPLNLVSKLGGEESNKEGKTECAAKDDAVPDGLDQLDGHRLFPERFLGSVKIQSGQIPRVYLYVADLKAKKTAKRRTARLKDRMDATGISSSSMRNSGRSQQILFRLAKEATDIGLGTRWPSAVYVLT